MLATKLRAATASVFNPAWDLAYAYYDPPANLAGDLSTAISRGSRNIEAEEISPQGVFLSTDLSKLYVCGLGGDDVTQWTLTAPGDVSVAGAPSTFSVAAQDTSPTGVFFKPDGLKMYISGNVTDSVLEYNLSTAWDVTTASYLQSFSVAAQDTSIQDLFFKPDGLKMYIVGGVGDDINEYNLSTAWDISTASYLQNFSVSAQETGPTGLSFSVGGTKMYVIGTTGDDVNEYNLSTAWDISTASYDQNYGVTFTTPFGLFVSQIGGNMYVSGVYDDGVDSIAYVRGHVLGGFYVGGQDGTPTGLFFKPDGLRMYIIGAGNDSVYEYDLSTAWDVGTATFVHSFSVASQETAPNDIFFKPDGTKMYITGQTGDAVYEYNLSTAWLVTSASYLQNFSVAAQEATPAGLFFKPDGLKMYVLGSTGDDVNEYNLSTAWNVTTASYLQNFSIAGQETAPNGIFFKPDGLRMYIVGSGGDDVNEYTLSTAWDISTASYLQTFPLSGQLVNPSGLFFKPDGEKIYIIGGDDRIYQYSIGIQE